MSFSPIGLANKVSERLLGFNGKTLSWSIGSDSTIYRQAIGSSTSSTFTYVSTPPPPILPNCHAANGVVSFHVRPLHDPGIYRPEDAGTGSSVLPKDREGAMDVCSALDDNDHGGAPSLSLGSSNCQNIHLWPTIDHPIIQQDVQETPSVSFQANNDNGKSDINAEPADSGVFLSPVSSVLSNPALEADICLPVNDDNGDWAMETESNQDLSSPGNRGDDDCVMDTDALTPSLMSSIPSAPVSHLLTAEAKTNLVIAKIMNIIPSNRRSARKSLHQRYPGGGTSVNDAIDLTAWRARCVKGRIIEYIDLTEDLVCALLACLEVSCLEVA